MNHPITSHKITQRTVAIFVALGGLAVVGMAAQWWISQEVERQLEMVNIPNVSGLRTDVATIRGDIDNIDDNVNRALRSQQRFEEIFMEYLQNEAQR